MDLGGGTLPVCGGKCKECERVNADARRSLDDAACRFRSCPMAGRTRQAPRSGPSSIAVRNDRYVKPRCLGDDWLHRGNLPNCELRHEHVLSPPRRKNMLMSQLTVRQIPTVQPVVTQAPRLHVAIISDGNGRWATSRGLPRSAGHRAGAESARRVIEAAPRIGIHTLTLFALSSANWQRPAAEAHAILRLIHA